MQDFYKRMIFMGKGKKKQEAFDIVHSNENDNFMSSEPLSEERY